jgi:DNA-binding beta-propeller fold protein YncE
MSRFASRSMALCAAAVLSVTFGFPNLALAKKDANPPQFFRLQSAVKLPGADPDWDYLAYDQLHEHLFIARRDAGLWVFDTRKQRLVSKVGLTHGAGAALLLPQLNRGFAINEDGSITAFDLASLAPIRRVHIADDADAASFDPISGRIAVVSSDSRKVTLVDPRSLAVIGTVALQTARADGSTADGHGAILLNERDRNAVLKINARTMQIEAEWPITGCIQPTGIAYDPVAHRAFIGCRGDRPVLAIVDGDNGATITTLPLGRGNDGVVFDATRKRIFTTNGVDSNLVIFRQDDADHYRMEQAVTTRPQARTMAYDTDRQRVFSVSAEGVLDPAKPVNSGPSPFYPNGHYAGSFVVLTYAPVGR